MRKVAIIDCGTNTFHLLIAELEDSGFKITYSIKTPVRIGKGGISHGMITQEGLDRATKVLSSFAETIKKHKVDEVYAFATSAFRNANNSKEVVSHIKENTGISVDIISGDTEAQYIYNGVKNAVTLGSSPVLIIDIGGGSIEFIIGNENEVLWKQSFEIGAQRLLDQFHHHDPITKDELAKLEEYLGQQLTPLIEKIKHFQPVDMIGSSGTFDTLSEIYCHQFNLSFNDTDSELPLTLEAYEHIHNKIITNDRDGRMAIPGMIEMRVDMIVVASSIIHWLLKQHFFNAIKVSTYSLKEGVLHSL
ncbi:Ppx/GppA phosphatase family protein [Fulvivirga ligni]|uniref:Ppx/GppA phosphatase family protein n=1 Tax=Fulvivirga ligni TaxID=2904246 RepID=UPI001F455D07|nr:exopolyphosphatase [Fulvivirga ligni]UII23000.1 exopolyphosphatase [Fulvivirga ligni]